jgi:nicotinamidase-related amidase
VSTVQEQVVSLAMAVVVPHLDARGLAEAIDPATAALLVIDVQRDFVAPDGFCGAAGADLSAMPAAIEAIAQTIAAARSAGVRIVFVRLFTSADADSPAMLRQMERRGRAGGAALCRTGTAGADYFGVAPQPGDVEVIKRRYDAFLETDLDARLRALGIRSLLVTGVSTDCCVDSTARAAFQRDYDVFVVSDACAAGSPELHRSALIALDRNIGMLVTADTVSAALLGGSIR